MEGPSSALVCEEPELAVVALLVASCPHAALHSMATARVIMRRIPIFFSMIIAVYRLANNVWRIYLLPKSLGAQQLAASPRPLISA